MSNTTTCKRSTPWGQAQYVTRYGRGVNFYGTARHGGLKVSDGLNATMPDTLRLNDGWYEEDCEYARVVLAFPDRFPAATVTGAYKVFRNYYPDAYEAHTGNVLVPGESHVRDRKVFGQEHANDLIVHSARRLEDGRIQCSAAKPSEPMSKGSRTFIVPADEYAERGPFGFIIDTTRHMEVI